MNKKIREIIDKHIIFNRHGVLVTDDVNLETLTDDLYHLFEEELKNERKD